MPKAKKTAKRKAPIKLTKRRPSIGDAMINGLKEIQKSGSKKSRQSHSSEPYLKLAAAIMQKTPEEPKTEISVRSVYHDGQFLPALCFRLTTSKTVPCIAGDRMGINLFEIDALTHDKAEIVMHGPESLRIPYPTDRFLAIMNKLVANGAMISSEALAALQRALHPFPVARPHALASAAAAASTGPAAMPRPVPENAPGKPVQPPASRLTPNRTDGKALIYELSRESSLPPEKVRAKLRASGLRAPYVDPVACRAAMKVPDAPKQPRKKK